MVTVSVATPLTTGAVPRVWPVVWLTNVTVPVGSGTLASPGTVAVRVTGSPGPTVAGSTARVTVLGNVWTSTAPMSVCDPKVRTNGVPRWSNCDPAKLNPASIAGLPASRAWV